MSLVEMLVVLAIVGVMSSIATLSIGAATRGGNPEAEAMRLASHIRLAIDEALVTDREVVLAWDGEGYAFQQRVASGEWGPSPAAALGTRHDLPSGLHVESNTPEQRLWIEPGGDGPTSTLTIDDGETPWHVAVDGFAAVAKAGHAP